MTAFLGRAAGQLLRAPSTGAPGYDSYGMAMRFHVKVDDVGDLGSWSGCHGLSVHLTPDIIREGGRYESPLYLPGEVTYGQVTLERAMQHNSSQQIRNWLADMVRLWVNGNDAGTPYEGKTVTITLCDAHGTKVADWVLHDAVPTAWLGPNLSGTSSEVAVERLQFAHSGFLADSSGSGSARTGTGATAKLTLMKSETESVAFSYNPTSMNIVRGTTVRSEGAYVEYRPQQVVDVETLSIAVTNLRLEGRAQVAKMSTLFSWLQPKKSKDGPDRGGSNQAEAPRLELKMGGGIHYDVTLNRLDVQYSRFNSDGVPIRAEVNITLADATQRTPRQNPTSGGPPGRRVHTVTEGDSLPRIAQATYADPNAWRDIAVANGIDDPLRVRNGRVLLLPGEPA